MINLTLIAKLSEYDSLQLKTPDYFSKFYEKIISQSISEYNQHILDYPLFVELFSNDELQTLRLAETIDLENELFIKVISMRIHLLNETKKLNNNYSFDKLVMMELLAKRVGLDLDRSAILTQIPTEDKIKICEQFFSYKFDISIDDNEYDNIADKRAMENFKHLATTKQYGELINIFSKSTMALDVKVYFIRSWANCFWKYFPKEFCNGLKQFSASQQLYYLYTLECEHCLVDFVNIYDEQELLPLAYCIYSLTNHEINYAKMIEYCLDESSMQIIATVISKIRKLSNSTYKELTNNLHMSYNHLWHCGFLLSMTHNASIDSSYFTEIDFGSNMGLYSFELLAKYVNNKIIKINLLEDIAKSIYGSFKMKLQDSDKTYAPYFYHSSYMNYFIYAIESKYNDDFVQFKYEIEYLAHCTQRQLFSWTPHLCIEPFSQLVYMVLAWRNLQFFKNHNLESLPETTKLFNSKKILRFFDFRENGGKTFFEVLLELLSSQENEIAFQLPDHSGKALDFTFKIPPQN